MHETKNLELFFRYQETCKAFDGNRPPGRKSLGWEAHDHGRQTTPPLCIRWRAQGFGWHRISRFVEDRNRRLFSRLRLGGASLESQGASNCGQCAYALFRDAFASSDRPWQRQALSMAPLFRTAGKPPGG